MTPEQKYLLALGGFRRAVHATMQAAAGLRAAAQELDPQEQAPDDPVASEILDECLVDLRGMAALMPGMRQLLALSLETA